VRARSGLSDNGTITLPHGTYEAYGQKLEIEKGALYFKGPLDNPGLDIRALRKHLAVEAGVELKGTARAPIIELVSNPEVPPGDKLSWLVLGRPLDPNNKNDLGLLQAAAGALLAQSTGSAPLQRQVARAIGLDEIGFAGTSTLDNQVVSLGKRLGDRLYVTYEQGLSTTTRVIRFNVNLTQRLTLRVEGGGTTNALDLFYAFSFD
jgi:translocation and assembly module TamB